MSTSKLTTASTQAHTSENPCIIRDDQASKESVQPPTESSLNSPTVKGVGVICAPLDYDEPESILQSLRAACHPHDRLIALGLKMHTDAKPAGPSQSDASTLGSSLLDDFRVTPASLRRTSFHGRKNKSGVASSARAAIVLDCEMVMCGSRQELAFLSVLDFVTGETLINTYVQPRKKITRWNTKWSGITAKKMNAARRAGNILWGWQHARHEVWRHADQDTVINGHDIRNDLNVLRIIHPKIVDTSI
ncbi:Uncharacterized protein PECH_000583 [Penicillium ucsense]|uniref:Exonuclease domain-containing protein n=1 Tax=Penicillium ucsense TaxID=2839758 RepID=A0A8J8VXV6_9EURO|nr:Uncharacterized protein PECM_000592 [Penicillium ucsense]KAF7733427.1 Uncharacterized protein PECH_000583 [Penicillium ucsense]